MKSRFRYAFLASLKNLIKGIKKKQGGRERGEVNWMDGFNERKINLFQVGDMISVIDMPPPGESTWWRGKHGFAVGFFPAECVAVIGDKVPRHLTVSTTVRSKLPVKPVLRKHGKLIAFFRSFILNRPSRRRLKQSGILKERVFGCDLGEHLLNSGQDGIYI